MLSRQELRTGDRVFFSAHPNHRGRRLEDRMQPSIARRILGFVVVAALALLALHAAGGAL